MRMRSIIKVLSIYASGITIFLSCGQTSSKNSSEDQEAIISSIVEEAKRAEEERQAKIAERNQRLINEIKADEILGSWSFNSHNIVTGVIDIYIKDSATYARIIFSDNSGRTETIRKESDGNYYIIENGKHNKSGEYYKINGRNLSVCDKNGNVGWFTQENLN